MRGQVTLVAVLAAGLVAVASAFASTASSLPPLRTGIFDPGLFANAADPDAQLGLARSKAAGASVVRLIVHWQAIATGHPKTSEQARDPNFPGYNWKGVDAQVTAAVQHGLSPLLDVVTAPSWAYSGSPSVPDAGALSDFATALATRYDGSTAGLPHVSSYMLWNEPNLRVYFQPQTDTVVVPWYRSALAAFGAAVHGVDASNVVVGGGLAPFGYGITPMQFIDELFCVGPDGKPTCADKVDIDAWTFHPYTFGGPTHKSAQPGGLSLGDVPAAIATIRSAVKAGNVSSHGALQFWVTEFSWDTSPPDPKSVPLALQARWTSEALYRLWSSGVSVVTWFLLRDQPYPSQPFQSGLYFAGATMQQDRPKPTLQAFRFPFVAIRRSGGYVLWGRTPTSKGASIRVQLKSGHKWKQVLVLHAGGDGVFEKTWKTPLKAGYVRAVIGKDASLAFGLKPVPDKAISPFGI